MKNFEERLTTLENLNEKMKEGSIPLDEAVQLFEEGIKLAKSLEKDLSKIERKVEILVNKPEDSTEKPNLELFEGVDESQPVLRSLRYIFASKNTQQPVLFRGKI